jgi:hypothetical protein
MGMKKYFCEVRKRKLLMAESYIDAVQKFTKFVEGIEMEPKVKLVTSQKQIEIINKNLAKARKAHINRD